MKAEAKENAAQDETAVCYSLNTASCQISYLCSNITFHSFDEGPVGKGSERHKIGDEENETTNRQHKSKVPLEGINVRHRHQLQTQEGMAAHVLAYHSKTVLMLRLSKEHRCLSLCSSPSLFL